MIFFEFHENNLPSVACIYLIFNKKTDRFYVGSTLNFKSRVMAHRSCLRRGKHHSERLQRSFDKHGEDCFRFVIASFCDPLCVRSLESIWINGFKEIYNTNQNASGGSNKGPVFLVSKEKTIEFANTKKAAEFLHGNGSYLSTRKIQRAIKHYTTTNGGLLSRKNLSFTELQSQKKAFKQSRKKKTVFQCKTVYAFDLQGNQTASFKCIEDAASFIDCKQATIYMACQNGNPVRKILWSFSQVHKGWKDKCKKPVVATSNLGRMEFDCIAEAARFLHCDETSVRRACKSQKIFRGRKWEFVPT
jgi:group I intron endonuclease